MRLTAEQRRVIQEESAVVFGKNTRIQLFGSRLDNAKRGGDIDLYIEAEGTAADLLDRELKLYARLLRRLGDRRIDIVVHGRGQPLRPIDHHARETGITL
jgi:predicted nucleotidyltransferase